MLCPHVVLVSSGQYRPERKLLLTPLPDTLSSHLGKNPLKIMLKIKFQDDPEFMFSLLRLKVSDVYCEFHKYLLME